MTRPQTSTSSAFAPTPNRSVPCRIESNAFQMILDGLEGRDTMDLIEDQVDQRMHLISFMEKQMDAWMNHPSNSTWSAPVNKRD